MQSVLIDQVINMNLRQFVPSLRLVFYALFHLPCLNLWSLIANLIVLDRFQADSSAMADAFPDNLRDAQEGHAAYLGSIWTLLLITHLNYQLV